ncbi:MAG: SlyX family protein [Rhodobacteraceae bacterium]|nr:SlyX family protein [Paracoccaceae bacterium]
MTEERLVALEEIAAHLARQVEELSAVVARQDAALARLQARMGMLMEREAEREAEAGRLSIGDTRPPHY